MTSEPRMESLLASIRRAIDEDIGGTRQASSPPQAPRPIDMRQRSNMRDQRRFESGDPNSASEEIRELRDKIWQAREREASMRAAAAPRAPRPSVFAETLGGNVGRPPAKPQPGPRPPQDPVFERPVPEQRLRQPVEDDYSDLPAAADRSVVDAWNEGLAKHLRPSDPHSQLVDPSLLSSEAATAANTAFNRLADTILSRAVGDRSVEDITRELLRNMLKQWLDVNLPALVEKLVREEIERVARRGR